MDKEQINANRKVVSNMCTTDIIKKEIVNKQLIKKIDQLKVKDNGWIQELKKIEKWKSKPFRAMLEVAKGSNFQPKWANSLSHDFFVRMANNGNLLYAPQILVRKKESDEK